MEPLRALLYARVSQANQKRRRNSETDEASLSQQYLEMELEAHKRNWRIVGRCEDVLTGSTPVSERAGGRQVYDLADRDAFDILMVYDNDRIGRDQDGVVAKVFRADLRFRRKQVFSVHQPIEPKRPEEYDPYEDDSALWLESVSDTASSVYIRQFRRRRAFGMLKRVEDKKLMPGKLPIGYVAERHTLPNGRVILGARDLDPVYAPIIQRIFSECEAGASAQKIATLLNNDGLRTPSGAHWTAGTLHGILDNPAYYGAVAYLKHRCTGPAHPKYPRRRISQKQPKDRWLIVEDAAHPPIITKNQWLHCQAIRRSRSTAGRTFGESTLLSGLLECGRCGSSLNRSGADYWVCSLARNTARAECNPGPMRVRPIEEAVLSYLAQLARNPQTLEQMVVEPVKPTEQQQALLSQISSQIIRTQQRLSKAREAYEAGIDSLTEFGNRKQQLEAELNGLLARHDLLKEQDQLAKRQTELLTSITILIEDIGDKFKRRPLRLQKAILRQLVERVVVTDENLHVRFRTDPAQLSEYTRIILMIQTYSEDDYSPGCVAA